MKKILENFLNAYYREFKLLDLSNFFVIQMHDEEISISKNDLENYLNYEIEFLPYLNLKNLNVDSHIGYGLNQKIQNKEFKGE